MSPSADKTGPDELVVVTGGSQGIGRGIAARFAASGARVIIVARHEGRLRDTATELGPRVVPVCADVSVAEDVSNMLETVVSSHGPIRVLVNAAGVLRSLAENASLGEAEAVWDETIATNLKGSFLVAWAAHPHMVSPGGRIIFVSSVAAVTGGRSAGLCPYAASKAGLHGMTFALARQLGPRGITVNAVALGLVEGTGLFADGTQERARRVAALTPVGRAGRIEDAVSAIAYLAGPESSFVTGEILHINGGLIFGR